MPGGLLDDYAMTDLRDELAKLGRNRLEPGEEPVRPVDNSTWWDRVTAYLKSGGWQDPQPGQRGTWVPSQVDENLRASPAVPGIIQQPADSLQSLMTAPLSHIVRSSDRDAIRAASEASFDVASMLPAAGVAAGRMRPRGTAPERAPDPAPTPQPREYSTGPEQIVPDYSYGRVPFQADWPNQTPYGRSARPYHGQDIAFTDPIGIYQTEVGVPGAATVLKYQDMPARMRTVGQDPVPGVRGMDGRPVYSNADDPNTAAIPAAMQGQRKGPRLQKSWDFETFDPDYTPSELRAILAAGLPRLASGMALDGASAYSVARRGGASIPEAIKDAMAEARAVKRNELSEWSDAMAEAKKGHQTTFGYDIIGDNGDKLGVANGIVVGDTMYFDWIGGGNGAGVQVAKLGVSGLKALREQVRKDFPNVKKFEGERVSGARVANNARNSFQSVKIASNPDDVDTAAILASMTGQDKPKGITAYHASPHTFDKFDMSKVGTGMGYLDEGHGLYFGTNKDWVDGYAKEIGPNAKRYEVSIDADPSKFLNWDDIPRDMQEILKTKRGADAARQVGVPGIVVKGGKYGDSYVMFDDKPISINRTYANPADPTTAAILALLTAQQGGQKPENESQGGTAYGLSDAIHGILGISPSAAMDYKNDDRASRNVIDRRGMPVNSQSFMDWFLYGNPDWAPLRNRALERWQRLSDEEKERLRQKDLKDLSRMISGGQPQQ